MRTNQLPYQTDEAWINRIEWELNALYGLSFPDDFDDNTTRAWVQSEVKQHQDGFLYRNYTLRDVPINKWGVTDATIRITVHLMNKDEYYTFEKLPHVFIQSGDWKQQALFYMDYTAWPGHEDYILSYELVRSQTDSYLY